MINQKEYLKNLYQGYQDPTQYEQTKQDLQIIKNENLINRLDELTKKYFNEFASDYLPHYHDSDTDEIEIYNDLLDDGYFQTKKHEQIFIKKILPELEKEYNKNY
jgi:hypothetical protein|tara:strand:+ start:3178 stop:3492 length:315 start_codon:yes stop_codon:yes gene_type:complete